MVKAKHVINEKRKVFSSTGNRLSLKAPLKRITISFCEEKDKKFCVDTFTFLEEIPNGESICQTITFQNFKHTNIIQV